MKQNKKIKKISRILTALLAAALLLSAFMLEGCSHFAGGDGEKLKIVATIFPEYDWVMNILGERTTNTDVTLLLDSGADLHSFQPSVADIAAVSGCDLFIYVGGESDEWIEDVLKNHTGTGMRTVNLLEVLGGGAKEEEIIEGMETGGEEDGEEADKIHIEAEYDEHVWLSLRNAELFVKAIASALEELDAANSSVYAENAARYIQKLDSLDKRYIQAVDSAKGKTLIFADRFPFRYLVDDYGLKYYAAFVGCSAETEASFETVVYLAGKAGELEVPAILKIESSDGRLAETVKNSTPTGNQKILTMDSVQSANTKEYASGRTYLGIMEENLNVLIEALG